MAAASLALSASLLEKLLPQPVLRRHIRRLRLECVRLIQEDAEAFARVIEAIRGRDRALLARRLKSAIAIPQRIQRHAETACGICRRARRAVPARLQSDLRCVMAVAQASGAAASILIATNRAWRRQAIGPRRRPPRHQLVAGRGGGHGG